MTKNSLRSWRSDQFPGEYVIIEHYDDGMAVLKLLNG
jgi:hypothetical protein